MEDPRAMSTTDNLPSDLVQSVDRAIRLLEALAEKKRFVSLQAVSEETGLNASTAHRLLHTLEWHDLVRRDPSTRKYGLGLGLLRLAAALRSQLDLRVEAKPFLESLAEETEESANLVVADGHHVVYVDQAASTQPVRAFTRVGARAQLHCTGVGKAILAFLPEEERRAVLDGELRAYTPTTITNPLRLEQELARIRESGVSRDMGERQADVRCVASPVFDDRSRVVAAISISGPGHRLDRRRMAELEPAVRKAGRDLSRALGWPGLDAD